MRAPENVRQTNKSVDVESLADDIAAHGLLQSRIGYAGDTDIDAAAVYIVGGGRRLQALQLLRERGAIDDSFAVPVLLRDPDDAINLSLSENLAKRDMNPADEFTAFAQLMQRGSVSPARSEEHTSELQSLMRISYAVFCLKKQNKKTHKQNHQ